MLKFGPTPNEHRPLRKWEACGDAYVHFGQRQALFHFSHVHPWLWRAYVFCAQVRCFWRGHEYSRLIEADKYVSNPKSQTNCLYCGKARVIGPGEHPGPLRNPDK